MRKVLLGFGIGVALAAGSGAVHAQAPAAEPGFVALFDGKTLEGWTVPEGDNGHWKVVDGVIDYDAKSEASGDKSLWFEKEFGDFELRVDWRLKEAPYLNPNVPIILADGTRVALRTDWYDRGAKGAFLHAVRDRSCGLFSTLLSPDYNRAHADHFHLDMAARTAGWTVCR